MNNVPSLRNRLTPPALRYLAIVISFFLPCCGKESSPKFRQYFNKGELLYIQHCSNCHQKDGSGLSLLYPPLNKSDFVEKKFEEVLCVMRYGLEGELIVNGKSYNKAMPPIPTLTDLEIAQIATFIYNSWERKRGLIEVKEASRVLTTCNHH